MNTDTTSELRQIIEYMAMCIGESKDERRDDTSQIFDEMEQKILKLIAAQKQRWAKEAYEAGQNGKAAEILRLAKHYSPETEMFSIPREALDGVIGGKK